VPGIRLARPVSRRARPPIFLLYRKDLATTSTSNLCRRPAWRFSRPSARSGRLRPPMSSGRSDKKAWTGCGCGWKRRAEGALAASMGIDGLGRLDLSFFRRMAIWSRDRATARRVERLSSKAMAARPSNGPEWSIETARASVDSRLARSWAHRRIAENAMGPKADIARRAACGRKTVAIKLLTSAFQARICRLVIQSHRPASSWTASTALTPKQGRASVRAAIHSLRRTSYSA
jgi:hypothetical protein